MSLKLGRLQNVVKNVQAEEKATRMLKNEVRKAMGPIINTDVHIVQLAENVNDRLDVLERTGRSVSFNTMIIAKFANHKNFNVRKMAARLLPENLITRFTKDTNRSVRLAVAHRLSSKIVKEMMKQFPTDEELRLIYAKKHAALKEGLVDPEIDDDEFDIYGNDRLGDDSKTDMDTLDLSDSWYKTVAYRIYQDYGASMLDNNWEERAVNAYCEHNKATNGTQIDKKKLFDAIQELIKKHDDYVMSVPDVNLRNTYLSEQYSVVSRPDGTFAIEDQLGNEVEAGYGTEEDALNATDEIERELSGHYDDNVEPYDLPANDWKTLGELASSLEREAELNESFVMPCISEIVEPIDSLLNEALSGVEYVKRAMKVFQIKESSLPAAIKKFVIGERINVMHVPQKAILPGLLGVREEQALDRFCEAWNRHQALNGEPIMINWYPHPAEEGTIGFEVKLR